MNQQATDILWRIIKMLVTGDPHFPCHVYQEYNRFSRGVAIEILKRDPHADARLALRRSVVAGSVGIDVKAKYAAAGPSPLVASCPITLHANRRPKGPSDILKEIDIRARTLFPIDYVDEFTQSIVGQACALSLVFFTDDFFETVFDLSVIQHWLRSNSGLNVTLVPKCGQHANDASYNDVLALLEEPLFETLRGLFGARFRVRHDGPSGSGINAYELSLGSLKALSAADVVVFKGARAYEMMQGLRRITFFGFNVLRSYTESLTGLDARAAPPVFLRQEPGLPSFDEFRARAHRRKKFTDHIGGIARMTALEYVSATRSRRYGEIVEHGANALSVNLDILARAKASGQSVDMVILNCASKEED